MGRVLRIATRRAIPGGRSEALAQFRRTRQAAKTAAVNYWVYEDAGEPGQWVEFVEARDADTLRAALRQLQLPVGDGPILSEVELD